MQTCDLAFVSLSFPTGDKGTMNLLPRVGTEVTIVKCAQLGWMGDDHTPHGVSEPLGVPPFTGKGRTAAGGAQGQVPGPLAAHPRHVSQKHGGDRGSFLGTEEGYRPGL
jgi:hypothetical protein